VPIQSYIPTTSPSWRQGALVAVACTVAAWIIRELVHPLLLSEGPYFIFVAAVLVSAIWGGLSGGVFAAILSGALANWGSQDRFHALTHEPSHMWSLLAFLMLSGFVIAVAATLTSTLRREAALGEQLGLVSRELEHRVKNVLALAHALVKQTARTAASVEEFEGKIITRLHALSHSQSLLLESKGRAISLRLLLEQVLRPVALEDHLEGPITGPDADIAPEFAVALSLLLNELATNASKYGALSLTEGRVRLTWIKHDRLVVIDWKESGGPPVTQPSKRGFGSRLFETALPRTRGGVEPHFEPDGFRCTIKLAIG
jgi:two-component sensor histidine kinase